MRYRLIILFLFVSLISSGATYYVASSGDDASADPTNIATPWKTISKVNSYWSDGDFAPGDNILFNKGDTFYGTILAKESGTSGSPIVVGAYGTGADPIITGFTTIPSWTNYTGNIYYYKVALDDTARLDMVLFDGVQTAMGRWPDAGSWANYDSRVGNSSITDAALPASPNYDGSELFFIKNTGLSTINRVTTHVDHTLNYNRQYSYGNFSDTRYFVQHHYNTLTTANEWYYDGDTLFIYSTGVPTATVQITTLDKLFTFDQYIDYITIDNIHFQGANLDCISANVEYQSSGYNDNITVQNCTVEYAGRIGIYLRGCDNWNINNCTIRYCNDLGIWSTGNSCDNTHLQNSTIRDIGLIWGSGQHAYYGGVTINQGTGQIAEYNEIRNIGRQGINMSAEGAYVRYNVIDTFCVNLSDGGGIYVGANTLTYHNMVTINDNIVFHGLTGSSANAGASGIYIDQANIWGNSILRNTVAHCNGSGIKLSNVTDVEVHDNNIYDCVTQIQLQDGAVVSPEVITPLDDLDITRNKYIAKTPDQILIWNRTDAVRQDEYGTVDSNYYARPRKEYGNFVYKYNLVEGSDSLTFAEWQSYSTLDAHSNTSYATVTTTDDIFFYYNASTTDDSVFLLPVQMVDIVGTEYESSVTLDAWESIVLLKDYTPAAVTGFAKSRTGTVFMKNKEGTQFMKIE